MLEQPCSKRKSQSPAQRKKERGCVRSTSRSTWDLRHRCGWVSDHSRAPCFSRGSMPSLLCPALVQQKREQVIELLRRERIGQSFRHQ
jgi:hypothetical protein